MGDSAIQLESVWATRRHHLALRDVTLEIAPGAFVGVLGPNGAGKTTLLTLINGLTPARSGRVRVLGHDLRAPHRARVRRRIAYVAQAERLDPRLPITVRESVAVGLWGDLGWFGRAGKTERQRVEAALERVGVRHLGDRPLGHLSGGEQQRTALARALVQRPALFLFDEPTTSIDPPSQAELVRLIEEVRAETGAAVLFVTHDLALLPPTCARLILMRDGRIVADGSPQALLDPRMIEMAFAPADGPGRSGAVA